MFELDIEVYYTIFYKIYTIIYTMFKPQKLLVS